MNDYPSNVKQKLNSIISDMSEHHWLFSNNPGHNFMRQHQDKLSFYDTMRLINGMGKGTTNDEIMDYFDMVPDLIPSQSAFNQRRSQISLSAFEYLFSEFSSSFPATTNKFKDHCMMNTLITNIVTRKQELAMLESIGMSKGQIRKMLLGESLLLVFVAVAVTMTIGTLLGYVLTHLLYNGGAFYISFKFPTVFVLAYTVVLIAVPLLITIVSMHSFSKEALVERLRGMEN